MYSLRSFITRVNTQLTLLILISSTYAQSFVNREVEAKFSNAEMIASYCDRLLKSGGGEKLSDQQTEEALDRVVSLFQVRCVAVSGALWGPQRSCLICARCCVPLVGEGVQYARYCVVAHSLYIVFCAVSQYG